jgi:hypothetical protein
MLIVANLVLAAANNIPEVFLGALLWACELYHQLELDQFFSQRLAPSRKGTRWDLILQTLVCYRLLDPGSEWRLHRQ